MIGLLLACTRAEPDTGSTPLVCDDTTLAPVDQWLELRGESQVAGEPWGQHPNFGGPGLALVDVDGDGWNDLAVADPTGAARLLMNHQGVLTPSDTVIPQSHSIAAGDIDGDGHLDLVLGRWEDVPDLLGLGDGAGGFTWSELPQSTGHTLGWTLADVDGDGDLDAFAARHYEMVMDEDVAAGRVTGWGSFLYRNEGGALQPDRDATPEWTQQGLAFMGQWLDADSDGDLDLYVVNDFGPYLHPNALLLNEGGDFVLAPESAADAALYGMGAAVDDVDGDGHPDLYVSNIGSPLLLVNDGAGGFIDATAARGAAFPPSEVRQSNWGIELVDLDVDGRPEAMLTFGSVVFWMEVPYVEDSDGVRWDDADAQADVLLWNDAGVFVEGAELQDPAVGRSVVAGDVDGDGRVELVMGHWTEDLGVRIDLVSVQGGCGGARVRGPIGTRVEHARGVSWILPATTFSTGPLEVVVPVGEVTRVLPDGTRDTRTLERGALW